MTARADELLADGGALSSEAALARYDALALPVRAAVLAESARWGSDRRDVYCYATGPCPLYTTDDWDAEYTRLTGAWLPGRTGTVRAQLAAHGWATAP